MLFLMLYVCCFLCYMYVVSYVICMLFLMLYVCCFLCYMYVVSYVICMLFLMLYVCCFLCYMYVVSYVICMFVGCCRWLNLAIIMRNMIDRSLTDNCTDVVLFRNNSQLEAFAN